MKFFVLFLTCVSACAANLTQTQARANSFINNALPTVIERQDAYLALHGRYWQGLLTHDVPPSHTNAADNDSKPNRFNNKPTDQVETWSDIFPEWSDLNFPASVAFEPYDGPQGKGWVAQIFMIFNSILYIKTINHGPETYRQFDWIVPEHI